MNNYNETTFGSSESIYLDNNDEAMQYRYADFEDQIKMLEARTNIKSDKTDWIKKVNFKNSALQDNLTPITFDGKQVSYKCNDCGQDYLTTVSVYSMGEDCECKLEY
ncbi:hypothetical protein L4D00_23375 [Photobacterium swingsii]|uniref:hypothetical protein n=1 Tax=Photobacterium swingsii TaxID=680026 RepID=UPI003D1365F0